MFQGLEFRRILIGEKTGANVRPKLIPHRSPTLKYTLTQDQHAVPPLC